MTRFNVIYSTPKVLQHANGNCLTWMRVQVGGVMLLLANMELVMMVRGTSWFLLYNEPHSSSFGCMSSVRAIQSKPHAWHLALHLVPPLPNIQRMDLVICSSNHENKHILYNRKESPATETARVGTSACFCITSV